MPVPLAAVGVFLAGNAALVTGSTMIAGWMGFSSVGPVAGSMAAAAQSTAGNVAAGSTFANLQSMAMGGSPTQSATGVAVGVAVIAAPVTAIGVAGNWVWNWMHPQPPPADPPAAGGGQEEEAAPGAAVEGMRGGNDEPDTSSTDLVAT